MWNEKRDQWEQVTVLSMLHCERLISHDRRGEPYLAGITVVQESGVAPRVYMHVVK